MRIIDAARRLLAVGALAGALSAAPSAARADVYSLHIGIDAYRFVPSLDGAAADARAFERLFASAGAQTRTLINGEATREAIVTRFREMAKAATAGDTIVLTYAGHGAQSPERFPGEEADRLDEFFVLGGFGGDFRQRDEMLLDNDIAGLFQEVDPGVTILFIADSCHSGTMTRSLDPRGAIGKSRQISVSRGFFDFLKDDDETEEDTFGVEVEDLPNVIFIAASRENELANEIRTSGKPRGALSVAVEEAMATNRAGIGTVTELEQLRSHVISRVRGLFGGRQNPDILYDPIYVSSLGRSPSFGTSQRGLDRMPGAPATTNASLAPRSTTALTSVFADTTARILVEGASAAAVQSSVQSFGVLAPTRAEADLVWDTDRGEIIDVATADMIGAAQDAATAQRVVDKWRAMVAVFGWSAERALRVGIASADPNVADDIRFEDGDEVSIEIEWPLSDQDPYPYLTIVNLANGGEVQYIFPYDLDPRVLGPNKRSESLGPFPVKGPFGADHVVVMASKRPMGRLLSELEQIHETAAVEQFLALLDEYASGDDVRVGVGVLYTAP